MRSNFGHTSKMRGDLAHDMRSRTEIKSSCDLSVMICVFINLQLYSTLDMPMLYQYKEPHETYFARVILGLALTMIILGCAVSSNIPSMIPGRATSTPSITPTPPSSPTPAPTYTPIPSVRIESADKAFFDGDIEGATTDYRGGIRLTQVIQRSKPRRCGVWRVLNTPMAAMPMCSPRSNN